MKGYGHYPGTKKKHGSSGSKGSKKGPQVSGGFKSSKDTKYAGAMSK